MQYDNLPLLAALHRFRKNAVPACHAAYERARRCATLVQRHQRSEQLHLAGRPGVKTLQRESCPFWSPDGMLPALAFARRTENDDGTLFTADCKVTVLGADASCPSRRCTSRCAYTAAISAALPGFGGPPKCVASSQLSGVMTLWQASRWPARSSSNAEATAAKSRCSSLAISGSTPRLSKRSSVARAYAASGGGRTSEGS
eukprot:scaffold2607_cov254-Pinguiococcus_pyrenoidosus.AAC.2